MTVKSQTIIQARPQDSGCIVNKSGIRTPYELRTAIQLCKALKCHLSTKFHNRLLRGLPWLQWPWWRQWWVVWVYTIRPPSNMLTGHIQDEYRDLFGCSLDESGLNTIGEVRVNTLRGVWVNIRIHSKQFCNRSTSGQPGRSTYSMVLG